MSQSTLSREITLLDATMIVVSGVIGGGIFFTPAALAKGLPQAGWIMAVWVFGALISYAGALTYAELASRYPAAGGHYVYIREAFGRLWAFLYGWMLLLIIATGALASLALALAGYVARYWPMGTAAQKLVAVGVIVILSIVNWLGVKPGARTTTALTIIKVGAFALLIAVGLFAPAPQPLQTGQVNDPGVLMVGILAALSFVVFSYGGWQQLNFVAGEVKDAERRVPLALGLGVTVVALVYLGLNWTYLRALGGPDQVAASQAVASDAASALLGPTAGSLVTVLIAISILAFSNVVVLVTPRVFYALGQDNAFFRKLSELHPTYRTPTRAIALQGIWTILLILIGNIGLLVNGVVFADWIFFGLGGASIFIIRRKADAPAPSYRAPLYPYLPIFFVLCAITVVLATIVQFFMQSLIGFAMLLVGAIVWKVADGRSDAMGQ